ncbi:MAG: sigma-70 family RNA polymerase sigma factor [Phycisphaerae bacterium]|jgi:RNA polymerase sigma factor (sigma-70 family)
MTTTLQKAELTLSMTIPGLNEQEQATYNRIPVKVDCVRNKLFESAKAEEQLFGPDVPEIVVPAWTHFPEVVEDIPQARSQRTILGARDEVKLFLQYNYARYRLGKLLVAQSRRRSTGRARQMVMWYGRVVTTHAKLIGANMALVLAMAKRTRIPNVEFSELVSEGNMALLRSVDKFDVARGFKFSTYACRAILKSFNRLATNTGRYRQHFPMEFDPDLERSDYDLLKHDMQREDSVDALREILAQNRANLTDVERTIIMERFAIPSGGKGRTLAEVGKMVGLTNERVRQIQNLALGKIRSVLDEDFLAA